MNSADRGLCTITAEKDLLDATVNKEEQTSKY